MADLLDSVYSQETKSLGYRYQRIGEFDFAPGWTVSERFSWCWGSASTTVDWISSGLAMNFRHVDNHRLRPIGSVFWERLPVNIS